MVPLLRFVVAAVARHLEVYGADPNGELFLARRGKAWRRGSGVAVPLIQDAVNAYVKLGMLPDEPVEVLPDAQVDALIGAPQARP